MSATSHLIDDTANRAIVCAGSFRTVLPDLKSGNIVLEAQNDRTLSNLCKMLITFFSPILFNLRKPQ